MLEARSVSKMYPGALRPAVDGVDVAVERGEFLALVGRSGSGKSTLLHMLSSLIRPDEGQVLFEGADVAACGEVGRNRLRREAFAVVFQQHHLLPYLSALENVLLPFAERFSPVGARERGRARDMLARMGLEGRETARPGELSGGEQQRVAIARALARGARVLFADEPTGSLDSATGGGIMDLLGELNAEGLTVVMVTHNPDYANRAHRAVRLEDGRVA